MNRLKKKMLLIISDDYSRNLTGVQNLRKKILVLCVASICLRAHVMRVMLRGVIFHLYTIWGPFPYMEWPLQDFKFMSTIAVCCQHSVCLRQTLKKLVFILISIFLGKISIFWPIFGLKISIF